VQTLIPTIYGYFGVGDRLYLTINLTHPAGMSNLTIVKEVSVTQRIKINKVVNYFTFSAVIQRWIQLNCLEKRLQA
jgi:hypothetical protein